MAVAPILTREDAQATVTRDVVAYVAGARLADFPESVVREGQRALLNVIGCAVGGCRHPSVESVWSALSPFAGPPHATLLARGQRSDALLASLLNCLASCIYTFDDAHADAVVHPSGPVAFALLAATETTPVSGASFLEAFILGTELTCRLSKAISVEPAKANLAWSQTGVAGGIGAALAVGKLLKLEPVNLAAAAAIALTQASGVRVVQGTPTSALMPAQAAPAGLRAALLARGGLGGPANALEGKYGFAETFSRTPDLLAITDGMGQRFEIERLTYKPYPCGIVISPIVDACLALRGQHGDKLASLDRVRIRVNPVTLALTDRRHPADALAAQVSLYHWAAHALLEGEASLDALATAAIGSPTIRSLRDKIDVTTDPGMETCAAEVTLQCAGAVEVRHHVANAVGSVRKPMTDEDLCEKFRTLCRTHLPAEQIERIQAYVLSLPEQADAGDLARMAQ